MPRPRKTKQGAKRLNTPIPDHIDVAVDKTAAALTVQTKRKVSRNDVIRHCLELALIMKQSDCHKEFMRKETKGAFKN